MSRSSRDGRLDRLDFEGAKRKSALILPRIDKLSLVPFQSASTHKPSDRSGYKFVANARTDIDNLFSLSYLLAELGC